MIVPEAILSKDNYIIDVITDFNNYMFNTYDFLLEKGLKTEDARCVLPNMCETKLIMTFNLRSLGNFMNERLCTRAQKEIRDFAKEIVKVLLSC
jgi:flavin-dependent thymidylate synthase